MLMADLKLPYAEDDGEDTLPPSHTPPKKRLSANIPALVGFLALAVIVIWGLSHLATLSRPWFVSLLYPKRDTTHRATSTLSRPSLGTPVVTQNLQKKKPSAPVRSASAPDLTVFILAIGVIDPMTGVFVNRPPSSPADIVAAQFDIVNRGGSSTGAWYFSALLPTVYGGYPYLSPVQEPLGPGDHVVNTLRFSPIISGGGVFSVVVDSEGMVRESNETNNTVAEFIPMMMY
ncbi:hypothetical protein FJY93_01215 [Candidatus Kaiserbacteria bacterium]|nr:hypothetical protein [Candidatus Kaiserbacteria bacterium]